MNLFLILDEMSSLCDNPLISAAVGTVKTIFTIIQFVVPAVLIILCAIDMFKAMTSGDEKKTKETQKTCIRRLVYALIVFLIIPLLSIILRAVGSVVKIDEAGQASQTFQTFLACWGGTSGAISSSDDGGSSSDTCTCKGYATDGTIYDAGQLTRESCEGLRNGGFCAD